MTDLPSFFFAVLLLLLVPGPTNTLLLTAGATQGLRRALPLLAAEALGYLVTIHLLLVLTGLVIAQVAAIKPAIQITCALYLLYLAWEIWRGSFAPQSARVISFHTVLITTLLNPKAFILAFAIVPYTHTSDWRFDLPYFLIMQFTIVSAGFSWVALGALIRSGKIAHVPAALIQRGGAIALALFAGLLIVRV
jgi:threonine/homoserine/homoserine lactone efflux protein